MMAEDVFELNSWVGRVQSSKQGPKKNITNLMLHLRNIPHLGPKLAFNDLTGNIEWHGRELKDSDYVDIRMLMEAPPFNFEANARDVPAAVMRTAEDNTINPVVDYLEGLKWDGKPRISNWLQNIFDADDTEINRAFGRMFLIAAVARALQPGCKVDTMLIAKGLQGIGKTSAFQALFGEEFVTGSITSLKGAETAQALQGVWAVDLGELEALNTSVNAVKNFLTLQRDRYRPPWGKHFIWRPRRMVFTGTTNEDAFLSDATGARRFWPFEGRRVDLSTLKRARDQLWAEAVRAFKDGEKWWIENGSELDSLAQAAQQDSYKEDIWAPRIDQFLNSVETRNRGCVTLSEVAAYLCISSERQDAKIEERIIAHMKMRDWWKRRCMRHGQNLNWWFPPETQEEFKLGRPRGA
ncbi:hypothetical protein I5E68_07170 [Novosphingobium sp. YJ-S2-02]|uniref:Virulence-associated protein E-like domain-containing protein n=1 Tax=Novosphingobium aureum TaxID=2792964 RepID=A0A931HC48_9SPHN|nr:virulence-associated E family protein [Novosphingobium aureum]MBH0112731.1 hypothetical protein [Novosphingobium aureum]